MIYLSVLALPFGVPAQSRHLLLPWHRPHLSLAFEPPHAPPQSVLQSLEESELQMPHLQQEKEKSWCGLVISKKKNSRGAGS